MPHQHHPCQSSLLPSLCCRHLTKRPICPDSRAQRRRIQAASFPAGSRCRRFSSRPKQRRRHRYQRLLQGLLCCRHPRSKRKNPARDWRRRQTRPVSRLAVSKLHRSSSISMLLQSRRCRGNRLRSPCYRPLKGRLIDPGHSRRRSNRSACLPASRRQRFLSTPMHRLRGLR